MAEIEHEVVLISNKDFYLVYCRNGVCGWKGTDLYGDTIPIQAIIDAYIDHEEYAGNTAFPPYN